MVQTGSRTGKQQLQTRTRTVQNRVGRQDVEGGEKLRENLLRLAPEPANSTTDWVRMVSISVSRTLPSVAGAHRQPTGLSSCSCSPTWDGQPLSFILSSWFPPTPPLTPLPLSTAEHSSLWFHFKGGRGRMAPRISPSRKRPGLPHSSQAIRQFSEMRCSPGRGRALATGTQVWRGQAGQEPTTQVA